MPTRNVDEVKKILEQYQTGKFVEEFKLYETEIDMCVKVRRD